MFQKHPIIPKRIRKITGSFGYIEHRFLRLGFFESLTHTELAFYVFLVLAADRFGLSHYSQAKIMGILNISDEDYAKTRDVLIKKDLIAFDGRQFQVLSLPGSMGQRDAPEKGKRTQQGALVPFAEIFKDVVERHERSPHPKGTHGKR